MKVYIQTDIEGVAGFCFRENRENTGYENILHRQRMYRLLTEEVNAAVRAAFDSGADEVLVNDNHGSGYNILFEELVPECRIIHGRNGSGPQWLPLLDETADALVLVGMHAMGGTKKAIIPHTKWEVNHGEIYLSEGSSAAALAGDLGVPTVFASGDDKIIAELLAKIPKIETATVKQALSPYMSCSVMPQKARQMIYEGVKRGLANRALIPPYKIKGPVTVLLYDSPGHIPPLKPEGREESGATLTEAFLRYSEKASWSIYGMEDLDGFMFPSDK